LRGSFLGTGAAWAFSINFGLLFGLLTVTVMLFASGLGFAPSHEFELLSRPRLSRRRLLGAFIRAILLALAAVLASWIKPVGAKPLDFGLRYGLVVELVGVGDVEWTYRMVHGQPAQGRLGLLGICLIICGVYYSICSSELGFAARRAFTAILVLSQSARFELKH
jgi:hypothetical protein